MTQQCECQPGFYLCPVAVALWDKVNACYSAYQAGQGTWEDYEQALAEYQAHFS